MGTKEQLCAEHAEWTAKYMRAHDRVSALLARCWEVRVGEELPVWVLTGESLTALDSAIKDEGITLDKLRETAHKLQELSQNK